MYTTKSQVFVKDNNFNSENELATSDHFRVIIEFQNEGEKLKVWSQNILKQQTWNFPINHYSDNPFFRDESDVEYKARMTRWSNLVLNEKPDVLLLQEAGNKMVPPLGYEFIKPDNGKYKNYRGVAILIRTASKQQMQNVNAVKIKDKENCLHLSFLKNNKTFNLFSIHSRGNFDNKYSNQETEDNILQYIKENKIETYLIAGDLNDCRLLHKDRKCTLSNKDLLAKASFLENSSFDRKIDTETLRQEFLSQNVYIANKIKNHLDKKNKGSVIFSDAEKSTINKFKTAKLQEISAIDFTANSTDVVISNYANVKIKYNKFQVNKQQVESADIILEHQKPEHLVLQEFKENQEKYNICSKSDNENNIKETIIACKGNASDVNADAIIKQNIEDVLKETATQLKAHLSKKQNMYALFLSKEEEEVLSVFLGTVGEFVNNQSNGFKFKGQEGSYKTLKNNKSFQDKLKQKFIHSTLGDHKKGNFDDFLKLTQVLSRIIQDATKDKLLSVEGRNYRGQRNITKSTRFASLYEKYKEDNVINYYIADGVTIKPFESVQKQK